MKISVIVPIYNVEKYLDVCIKSIVEQTYKNIEIILINDGSTDNSLSICEKWVNIDNRIKIINKKNGGLSEARNSGIEVATGEYVAFVDSDDIISKNMLEILFNLSYKYDADISQGLYKDFYDDNEVGNEEESNSEVIIEEQSSVEAIRNLYNLNLGMTKGVVWNKLYKRNLFKDIRFPVGKVHEDEFVNYLLYYKANKIVNINKEIYFYRKRPGSITNNGFSIKRLDVLEAFYKRIIFLEEKYKNDIVCDYALDAYCTRLINSHQLYYMYHKDDKETLNKLLNDGKLVYKKYISNKKISKKRRVKYAIWIRIYPLIYFIRRKKFRT